MLAGVHRGLSDLSTKQTRPVQGLREPEEAGGPAGGYEGLVKPPAETFGFLPGQMGSPGRAGTWLWKEGKRNWLEGSPGAGEVWPGGPLTGAPGSQTSGSGSSGSRTGEHREGGVQKLSLVRCVQAGDWSLRLREALGSGHRSRSASRSWRNELGRAGVCRPGSNCLLLLPHQQLCSP